MKSIVHFLTDGTEKEYDDTFEIGDIITDENEEHRVINTLEYDGELHIYCN